jgi:hypothetical protein
MSKPIEWHEESVFGLSRTQLLVVSALLSIGLWMAFAKLAVPPVIQSAYQGTSYGILNRVIQGQSELPVQYYLQLWDRIALTVLVSTLAFWMLSLVTTSKTFFRRFVGNATPGTLGVIRAWTCTILLLITLWDDLGSLALLPPEYRTDMGLITLIQVGPLRTLFDSFLGSETALRLFQRVTELMLFLGLIGWRTRATVPLATLLTFTFNGILREYSFFWHQGLVPLYVLAILSFTPCGDGFSMDRLRRIYKGEPVPDANTGAAVYGWARYACWTAIALTYSAAGLSKLRASGLGWVSATNVRGTLYEQTLYPRAGNYSISLHLASAPDIVFVLLGIAAVCGEVFFATVLISRIARRILPATIILMHVGIILLQNIVFLDFMALLLIFYDFRAAAAKIESWMRRRRPAQVLFDGMWPPCNRAVRVLRAMDFFRRLEFVDSRTLDIVEHNRTNVLSLVEENLEKKLLVVTGGKAYSGFEGYRLLALRIPALWPLAPVLFLPGVSAIGRSVDRHFAHTRIAASGAESSVPRTLTQPSSARTARQILAYGTGTAALVTVMGTFWAASFEYYPFTDMHMFAAAKTSVIYYKVLGHWSSGQVTPFQLEDTLGAMSINSRYEPLFDLCFGDAGQVSLCRKTLAVMTSAYNRKARGKTLTDVEIQRWVWDYVANPNDPNYGTLEARFVAGLNGQPNPEPPAAARN